MPELPDIEAYLHALRPRILGATVAEMRFGNPFVLRTVAPAAREFIGRRVDDATRLGKRIVISCEGGLCVVIHLMIAGRLHWATAMPSVGGRRTIAAIGFSTGVLTMTEASTQKRASISLVAAGDLAQFDRGGIDPLTASTELFAAVLRRENHTLKRALTDPTLFSGIGNAYSDEILHRARLSPVTLTKKLDDTDVATLQSATRDVLQEWTARLCMDATRAFPERVTAFRPDMAVHGKFGQACPSCGDTVQRIRYASNESNYCPRCQTGGRLLADRALSRLLGRDWPRTPEALDDFKRARRADGGTDTE